MPRKAILGDAFRRVYRRGDWIWPHKNIAGTPSPHEEISASEVSDNPEDAATSKSEPGATPDV